MFTSPSSKYWKPSRQIHSLSTRIAMLSMLHTLYTKKRLQWWIRMTSSFTWMSVHNSTLMMSSAITMVPLIWCSICETMLSLEIITSAITSSIMAATNIRTITKTSRIHVSISSNIISSSRTGVMTTICINNNSMRGGVVIRQLNLHIIIIKSSHMSMNLPW